MGHRTFPSNESLQSERIISYMYVCVVVMRPTLQQAQRSCSVSSPELIILKLINFIPLS